MALAQSLISFSLLIVEDDASTRDIIARMIPGKYPNSVIYTAENGVEGIEVFKKCTPDIVVTDIDMPLMEGFEMIRQIGLIPADAAFIVLTARSDKLTYERFRDLKVCAYLLKPLDFKELFTAIEKCIAGIARKLDNT
jgi:YesN/AraC family two-component response regulator